MTDVVTDNGDGDVNDGAERSARREAHTHKYINKIESRCASARACARVRAHTASSLNRKDLCLCVFARVSE